MSRIMTSYRQAITPATFTHLLTPPAGKKIELLTIGVLDFGGSTSQWIFYIAELGVAFWPGAQLRMAAGDVVAAQTFNGIEISPPLQLWMDAFFGGTASSPEVYITYMLVDT